jgi:hypothetical protein
MAESNQYLWEGTIAASVKKFFLIISIILFIVFGILLLYMPGWCFGDADDLFICILCGSLIGILLFMVILLAGVLVWYGMDFFPHYYVRQDELIRRDHAWWGKERVSRFDINKINVISIVEEGIPATESFRFFIDNLEELLHKYPDPDAIYEWKADFEFSNIDTADELLVLLQTLIPLKEHPTLVDVYQRIE